MVVAGRRRVLLAQPGLLMRQNLLALLLLLLPRSRSSARIRNDDTS
jgi:hypothetical protein